MKPSFVCVLGGRGLHYSSRARPDQVPGHACVDIRRANYCDTNKSLACSRCLNKGTFLSLPMFLRVPPRPRAGAPRLLLFFHVFTPVVNAPPARAKACSAQRYVMQDNKSKSETSNLLLSFHLICAFHAHKPPITTVSNRPPFSFPSRHRPANLRITMALSSSSPSAAFTHQPPLAFAGPGFLAPAHLQAARQQQHQPRREQSRHSSPSVATARRPRGFHGILSMSGEGGAETEASTAEVPEATKRLLEQAAKIRAEVRVLVWRKAGMIDLSKRSRGVQGNVSCGEQQKGPPLLCVGRFGRFHL